MILPIPLKYFAIAVNLAVQTGLAALVATLASRLLGPRDDGSRSILWTGALSFAPFFAIRSLLWPSFAFSFFSMPQSATLIRPIPGTMFPPETWEGPAAAIATPAFSSAVTALFLIWLIGAIAFHSRLIMAAFAARRISRNASPVADPRVLNIVSEAAESLNCRRRPPVKSSPEIAVPAVIGFFRPAIVLPRPLPDWPDSTLAPVLRHEMVHVRGLHPLWRWVGRAAGSVLWFIPTIPITLRRAILDQEIAADHAAVSRGIRPSDYAQILLNPVFLDTRARTAFGDGMNMKTRLTTILRPAGPPPRRSKHAAIAVLAAVAIVCLSALQPLDMKATSSRTTMVQMAAHPHPFLSNRKRSAQLRKKRFTRPAIKSPAGNSKSEPPY